MHLSRPEKLDHCLSPKPYVCHPHRKDSCDHYPKRLGHIGTGSSKLRRSDLRNALRECWRCIAAWKRLVRCRFIQEGAQGFPLQLLAWLGFKADDYEEGKHEIRQHTNHLLQSSSDNSPLPAYLPAGDNTHDRHPRHASQSCRRRNQSRIAP